MATKKKKTEPAQRETVYSCPACGAVTKRSRMPAVKAETTFQVDPAACRSCR